MGKRIMLTCSLLLALAIPMNADAQQQITVNGQQIEKTATQLTFQGDNVVLHFDDGTDMSADMALVDIVFDTATGIGGVESYLLKATLGGKLIVNGLTAGETVSIYDAQGRLMRQTRAAQSTLNEDISNLPGGMYLLKVGKKAIKFVKR